MTKKRNKYDPFDFSNLGAACDESLFPESLIQESLKQLPKDEQEIINKRFYQKLTYTKIAKELGVSASTASKRTKRAMTKLTEICVEMQKRISPILVPKTTFNVFQLPPAIVGKLRYLGILNEDDFKAKIKTEGDLIRTLQFTPDEINTIITTVAENGVVINRNNAAAVYAVIHVDETVDFDKPLYTYGIIPNSKDIKIYTAYVRNTAVYKQTNTTYYYLRYKDHNNDNQVIIAHMENGQLISDTPERYVFYTDKKTVLHYAKQLASTLIENDDVNTIGIWLN